MSYSYSSSGKADLIKFLGDKARKFRGMTLVELVLALLLLNAVILTGISLEFATRRITSSTDLESQLIGEIAPIVSRIIKDASQSVGNSVNWSYSIDPIFAMFVNCDSAIAIRLDANSNGFPDAADEWSIYGYNASLGQMILFPDALGGGASPSEVLSDKISGFDVRNGTTGEVIFAISARNNPLSAVNITNLEVTINSSVNFRGSSFS